MGHFDKIADFYDDILPQHISEHYYFKRLNFLTKLLKKGTVLDVCSGTGLISEGFIERGFKVVSLDASLRMLMIRRHIEHYQPVNALSHELPFKSNSFDIVISIAAFHHIAEKDKIRKTLIEMTRVLRKGGHIVIWDHNPMNPYWRILMKKVPQDTGEERLIRSSEIINYFKSGDYSFKIFKSGFIPDFAPKRLMRFCKKAEMILEYIPLVNFFAAHNVIVIKKL